MEQLRQQFFRNEFKRKIERMEQEVNFICIVLWAEQEELLVYRKV